MDGMVQATGMHHETFCLSCFSGDYPVPLEAEFSKTCFEEDICAPGPLEGRPPVCEP
jgi:glutamine phosphoribosylpyrophosphate amidotransferase